MTEDGSSKRVAQMLGVVLLIASAACTEPPSTPTASTAKSSASTDPEDLATAPTHANSDAASAAYWWTEPDLFLIDPATGAAEVLLRAPGVQTNGELSPDGERVVFQSRSDDTWQIVVLEPGGTTQQLTHGPRGARDPTWSPDGSQIAFVRSHGDGSDADLFVMDADGSHIRRLVGTELDDGHPDWSPDGSRIAFHSGFETQDNASGVIWVASVRTGTLTRLTGRNSMSADADPAWSPDGRWIAYSAFTRGASSSGLGPPYAKLGLKRPDGTGKRVIVGRVFGHWMQNPSWSPDGTRIVFEDNHGPLSSIRVIDVRTRRIRTVLSKAEDAGPSWSRRGIPVSLSEPVG